MRAEIAEQREGDYFALNGYEVASRLSYMLWGSMPDDELFRAAESGALSTSEGILEQARRMMGNEKARQMVSAFHEHFLHMGPGTRWQSIVRDSSLFPSYRESMANLLADDTERFFDHIVFEQGGTFQDLLTSPLAFVNRDLAPLYGLDPASYGSELVPVNLDPATRTGAFTRLGFLASHSLYDRTSPILRGAFIQKHVLCTPIGAPPADAEGTPLPTEGLDTNRARVDAQTEPAACKSCHHTVINPTGFALESFNAVGAFQDTESFSGAPIDTSVNVLIGQNQVALNGPAELFHTIASAPEAHICYARQWVQHAYRRELTNADSCTVENMADKLTKGGYTVADLIIDLTQSMSFRYRALETELAP
jgi:hypothetical protein